MPHAQLASNGEARFALGTVTSELLTAASEMGSPEIYAYLDYRQFLRDWR